MRWIAWVLLGALCIGTCGAGEGPQRHFGAWDGVTKSAELDGPYADWRQQEIPFGQYSLYLTPWRAYMDTWPASRLLECPGINFNVSDQEAAATAQLLSEAGIVSARVEIGWGGFDYDHPDQLPEDAARRLAVRLQILQKYGIRPLLLLNGHHGMPCPTRYCELKLASDAAKGDRSVMLEDVKGLRAGYSGIDNAEQYVAAEILFVAIDAASGKCELSKPLPRSIKAGEKLHIHTLKYQPFSGAVFEDGTANPAAQETLDGWMKYVAGMCRLATDALGTAGAQNAGFDLEVWNEYTFGSNFLEEKNYFDPPRKFKTPVSYTAHGQTRTGVEIILPMTVDYGNDPKNKLPGVKVLSGFSNQRPWESGSEMWPGQAGFSRHYYTGLDTVPRGRDRIEKQGQKCLDAQGKPDAVPFIPTVFAGMPEYYHYGYQTEFMTRDVQPLEGPWKGHFRGSHPEGSGPAEVWMTEFNMDRRPFAEQVMRDVGCKADDPRLTALMHHVGTKALLRSLVFHSHKGVHTIDFFAAKCDDLDLAIMPTAFFKKLDAAQGELTAEVRKESGPQLAAMQRVVDLMRQGKQLAAVQALSVEKLVEHKPRLVFAGDGTAAHPDRFHRDDFACLPFQLDRGKYAVGCYVVTRNMGFAWQPQQDRLDPTRYDMPEQWFDLSLRPLKGKNASLALFDPLTGHTTPLDLQSYQGDLLTMCVPVVDYPRFLLISTSE